MKSQCNRNLNWEIVRISLYHHHNFLLFRGFLMKKSQDFAQRKYFLQKNPKFGETFDPLLVITERTEEEEEEDTVPVISHIPYHPKSMRIGKKSVRFPKQRRSPIF